MITRTDQHSTTVAGHDVYRVAVDDLSIGHVIVTTAGELCELSVWDLDHDEEGSSCAPIPLGYRWVQGGVALRRGYVDVLASSAPEFGDGDLDRTRADRAEALADVLRTGGEDGAGGVESRARRLLRALGAPDLTEAETAYLVAIVTGQ